jgi:hypothetical protein
MTCPFFEEAHNIGFCNTSESPYIPSVCEMERQCFTDSFGSCINYLINNLPPIEHNLMSYSQLRA